MKLYLTKYHWYLPTNKPSYAITATQPDPNDVCLLYGAASPPTIKIIDSGECPFNWDEGKDEIFLVYPIDAQATQEEIAIFKWFEKQF